MYTTHDLSLDRIDYFQYVAGKSAGMYADEYVSDAVFSFDIETTSFFIGMNGTPIPYDYNNPNMAKTHTKGGILYHWQMMIEGNYFSGRTWEDLNYFLNDLSNYCPGRKFVYVHNFAFEFAWLLNIIDFSGNEDQVFARECHRPMKSYTSLYNIEFRCSYFLTQKSLDKWGKELGFPKGKDFDYNKIRTPLTPMSTEEKFYCRRDVEIIDKGIKKYRTKYKHVYAIPMTLTGEVRRQLRNVFKDKKAHKHYEVCKNLMPQTLEEYQFILNAFSGGLVRRNPAYSDITIRVPMLMKDINSSYPWAMISERYPLTPFIVSNNLDDMDDPDLTYIVEFEATNVESVIPYLYLSSSKCSVKDNVMTMNGAIATADRIRTVLTKPDFELFQQCYKYETINVITLKTSRLDWLPDAFCKFIIECYKNKTEQKGKDPEIYQCSKIVINALFGIQCQKLLVDNIMFDANHMNEDGSITEWFKEPLTEDNFEERLYDITHNANGGERKINIAAQIGTFITAYARNNLMRAVLFDPDLVVYTDTDSVKMIHSDEAEQYFIDYNANILEQHKAIAKRLGIDPADLSPIGEDEDNPGQTKAYPIGIMDDDHSKQIVAFRTLGAKKYCCEYTDGSLHITVAGVPKDGACCLDNIDQFTDGLVFSAKKMHEAGKKCKMIPYYITNQTKVKFEDGFESNTQYGICLVPTDYNLSASNDMYESTDEFYIALWKRAQTPKILQAG